MDENLHWIVLGLFSTIFPPLTQMQYSLLHNGDNTWLYRSVDVNTCHVVCVMILGLQCLDPRPVWLLMGHDGTFLEHSTCAGQSSGSSIWRGHLHQTYGKSYISFVEYLLSVTGITNRIGQDYCCTSFPFSNPSPKCPFVSIHDQLLHWVCLFFGETLDSHSAALCANVFEWVLENCWGSLTESWRVVRGS